MADLEGQSVGQQLIVKADEVDHVGTLIASPTKQLPLSALRQIDEPSSAAASSSQAKDNTKPSARPTLRRDGSAPPPPPSQPPPPAPVAALDSGNATDSLSLPQLRQLVNQFPKVEQRAYAFQYTDAQSFEDEIEEWFHYSEQDQYLLLSSRDSFESRWRFFCSSERQSSKQFSQTWGADEPSWLEVDQPLRQQFVLLLSHELASTDVQVRVMFLETIFYVLCGTWGLSAGLDSPESESSPKHSDKNGHDGIRTVQIEWMHIGVDLMSSSSALQELYDCTIRAFDEESVAGDQSNEQATNEQSELSAEKSRELSLLLTCWYLIIESVRARACDDDYMTPQALLNLKPEFLVAIVRIIARVRWQESSDLPLTQLLHLFWKALLLVFGGTGKDLDEAKRLLQPELDPYSNELSHPLLTASPLDYHLFRQEITSKYPAYNPPLPLIPLELEHKSMLPPVSNQSSKSHGSNGVIPGFGVPETSNSTSILHQPVHIATPAPSPPPSPVGPGGKAGKKQNYQTNQNFPFLYPPLDDTSNNIGGKGTTEMQDLMVGKRWEGSDIPTSIIEAGQLFASRMRMTRAMRQLWRERELFLKHERGWNGTKFPNSTTQSNEGGMKSALQDGNAYEEDEDEIMRQGGDFHRLAAVEEFYHHAMPDLQSLVIVMMKAMVKNVQDIAVQNGSHQENGQSGALPRNKSNANVNQAQSLPIPPPPPQIADLSSEGLDAIRSREISQKSISGAIFILLKWLKLSHVLKFEYFTQLLLDSNYIPIALKYFAHQNLEDMVAIKYDREDLGFFHLCHLNSDHPPLSPTSPQPASEPSSADEAAPPPIQRHRHSPTSRANPDIRQIASPEQIEGTEEDGAFVDHASQKLHPSVDELGNPLAPLPSSPITDFSFRQFQTSIHLLRILQKITRSKAHRILLLVQYKSSQVLRRILRVPDPMLRLYVLKLFKSQVPYCGRKWRQSNMRVITAIYLHCRPELRDEWLAGMHDSNVEGEVDDAVPLEWALRGLTYWWQKRVYGDVMKIQGKDGEAEGGQEIEEEERDFFQRELDTMGWGFANLAVGDDVAFGEEAPGTHVNGGEQWEQGGPLNMEGW